MNIFSFPTARDTPDSRLHGPRAVRPAEGGTRQQIARQIRELVLNGRLKPRAKLPSTRALAEQLDVARDIGQQIASGSKSVFGVMIESHIEAGAQKFTPGKDDVSQLAYGQSITDACLGWDDSLQALAELSDAVKARRAR